MDSWSGAGRESEVWGCIAGVNQDGDPRKRDYDNRAADIVLRNALGKYLYLSMSNTSLGTCRLLFGLHRGIFVIHLSTLLLP